MYPIIYRSDTFVLDSYSVFFILAWTVGGVVFYREFRRMDWELEQMLFIMAGCVIGAVIGSYVLNFIFITGEETYEKMCFLDFTRKTVIGGITGGFIGVELTKKKIGYQHSTGDAFALAITLGHAIGRIGCFLGGCCFGTECHLPWAVTYPEGSVAHMTQLMHDMIPETAIASLPVHPTQIYEIIFNLSLFGFFWKKRDSFKVRGSMFRLYLCMYGGFRLMEEFVRGDSFMPEAGIMKPVQWMLITAVLYFGWIFYKNELKPENI